MLSHKLRKFFTAVSEFVSTVLELGCQPDHWAFDSPYENGVDAFWVLHRYINASEGSKYGWGHLYEDSQLSMGFRRYYRAIVAEGNGQLTVAETPSLLAGAQG